MGKKRNRDVVEKDYDGEDMKVEYALTPEEKELCIQVVTYGPEFLRHAKGWKKEAITRFVGRAEVQREVAALKRQYEDRTGIQERTQYFAQLRINGMVPLALNTLARTLRGEYVSKDEAGKTKRIEPPSRMQYEAALQVLDRANIQGAKYGGHDQTPSIDARSISVAIGTNAGDGSAPLDAEGRARVADVLNNVLARVRATAEAKQRVPMKGDDEEVDDDGSSED